LALSYFIEDSIAIGNGRKAIFSLILTEESMIFTAEDAALTFGAPLMFLRKKVSKSLPHAGD